MSKHREEASTLRHTHVMGTLGWEAFNTIAQSTDQDPMEGRRDPPPPHGQQRRQLTQGIGGNSGGLRSQDKSLPPEESASRSYHSPRGKSSARPHQLSSERRERPSQVSPQDPYSSERVPALERLSGQTQSHNTPPTE